MAKLSDKIKQSSVSDRIRVAILAELENIAAGGSTTGLATEATALNILNAIVASGQDIEVLLVRDTGDSDKVLQQITDYINNTTVYKDVNGNIVVPVGPLEYLDPSAVLNLILTQLQVLNAGGQLLTEATFVAEDFATETTLKAVEVLTTSANALLTLMTSDLAGINTEIQLTNIELSNIKVDTGNIATDTSTLATPVTALPVAMLRVNVAGAGSITPGKRRVSFFNAGNTDAQVAGAVLERGETVTFSADGLRDTLAGIIYDSLTSELLITTVG